MMSEVEKIAAGLTDEQQDALIDAARLLENAAGEGLGFELPGIQVLLFADDVVARLAEVFGIEWGDDFGIAVRQYLQDATS